MLQNYSLNYNVILFDNILIKANYVGSGLVHKNFIQQNGTEKRGNILVLVTLLKIKVLKR